MQALMRGVRTTVPALGARSCVIRSRLRETKTEQPAISQTCGQDRNAIQHTATSLIFGTAMLSMFVLAAQLSRRDFRSGASNFFTDAHYFA